MTNLKSMIYYIHRKDVATKESKAMNAKLVKNITVTENNRTRTISGYAIQFDNGSFVTCINGSVWTHTSKRIAKEVLARAIREA